MNVFTLLGILFIGLKLAGVITWSWVLVLLPFFAGFIIFGFAFVVLLLAELSKEGR